MDIDKIRIELNRQSARDYAKVEALISLVQEFGTPGQALPSFSGWALSPVVLRSICDFLKQREKTRILELGSGSSSIFLTENCDTLGIDRLVSLDQHCGYLSQTGRQIMEAPEAMRLKTTLTFAPLIPVEVYGELLTCYDVASLTDDDKFDLLVIDGPSGANNPDARRATLPVFRKYLTDEATIILDDAERAGERRALDWWAEIGLCEGYRTLGCVGAQFAVIDKLKQTQI